MGDAEAEKKIEVLKKAVLKLKSQNLQLDEEAKKAGERVAAAEADAAKAQRAHEAAQDELQATRSTLRIAEEEIASLHAKTVELEEKNAKLLEDASGQNDKKDSAGKKDKGGEKEKEKEKGGGFFSGMTDMLPLMGNKESGKAAASSEDVAKLEELLMKKTMDEAALQSRLFDTEKQLREAARQRDLYQGKYGEETVEAVSKISVLEEELRIAKQEEARLAEVATARTEEHSQLEVQHRASLEKLTELQERLGAAGVLTRSHILCDTARNRHFTAVSRGPQDRMWFEDVAAIHTELAAVLGNIVRDVQALFANATERVHILLSKATATAGPVKVAALRVLKDSLRKANGAHSDCSKQLLAALEGATAKKKEAVEVMKGVVAAVGGDGGGDAAALLADTAERANALADADAATEGLAWLAFLGEHFRSVLLSLFTHSPTTSDDAEEEAQDEVARLQRVVLDPLAQLQAHRSGASASTMRLLKNSVKELTEVVSGLFAKEVRVAWELAGFDSVNKRILTVLNALHTNINRAVELRNALARQQQQAEEGARGGALAHQRVALLPPEKYVAESEKAALPQRYFGDEAVYNDATTAKLRLHCRGAAFMHRAAAVPLLSEADFAPPGHDDRPPADAREAGAATPQSAAVDAPHAAGGEAAGPWAAGFVDNSCALLDYPVDVDAFDPQERSMIHTYRHYLECADAKAVEYRVEWQRTLFDLEERTEQIQDIEQENAELRRRLKNSDIEVKEMSHGYTDQMRVLQDKILDLENRLASASGGRKGR